MRPPHWLDGVIGVRKRVLACALLSICIVDPRNWTTTLSRIPGRIGPVFGRKAWQRSGDGSRRR